MRRGGLCVLGFFFVLLAVLVFQGLLFAGLCCCCAVGLVREGDVAEIVEII